MASAPPSITASEADAEVIVVGAGPAGCTAALLLARRGRRVLLLDRQSVPHQKLCTHAIMPAGLAVLDQLGVLPAIEEAGAQPWYGVRLWLNGTRLDAPLPRRRVAFPYGLSLRRPLLDGILLEAARQQPGVELCTTAQISRLTRCKGDITGVLLSGSQPGDASPHPVKARHVILAGGRNTYLARGNGLRSLVWPNRHAAHIAYIDGIPVEDRPVLEGYHWRGHSASLLPADGGLRVAGVMAVDGAWPASESADRLLTALRRFTPLRSRLASARVVTRPVLARGLRNVWRGPSAPGLTLIGDAGIQTDPLFGQGISWALRTGAWAAQAVDMALCGEDGATFRELYAWRRARILLPRFVGMAALSWVAPGSLIERLLVANAVENPASTRLILRLILGFTTISRREAPRRSLATWMREALRP